MDASITIENSTTDDVTAVNDVLEASYPDLMRSSYNADILRRALPAMIKANPKLLASGSYYVARHQDGSVVGCGGWSFHKPGTTHVEAGVGHIRHFAILPTWIGRGIGRQIYQACEQQARSQRVTTFEVFASLNAVPFYTLLGFDQLEPINVAMGPGINFPSVWMRRSIGDPSLPPPRPPTRSPHP